MNGNGGKLEKIIAESWPKPQELPAMCMESIERLLGIFHRKDMAHRKALDAMFCNYACENCTVTGLGVDFMYKVVSDERERYDFLSEKLGVKHTETTWRMFSGRSPTIEELKIKCDLFDVEYEQCYKVILEWIDGKKDTT